VTGSSKKVRVDATPATIELQMVKTVPGVEISKIGTPGASKYVVPPLEADSAMATPAGLSNGRGATNCRESTLPTAQAKSATALLAATRSSSVRPTSGRALPAALVPLPIVGLHNEIDHSRLVIPVRGSSGAVVQLEYKQGRPNLDAVLCEMQMMDPTGRPAGVVSCGPAALVEDVRAAAVSYGYHIHEESFHL
jgi:hypothetical protein